MNLKEFLDYVISDGIMAARNSYHDSDEITAAKLAGSIAGFETCRNLDSANLLRDLHDLLVAAETGTNHARDCSVTEYWWYRCFELEVEWVCNCVSAVLINEGKAPIITPTARGVLKAADIISTRL